MSCTRLLATMAIFGVLLLTAVWALGGVMTKQNADSQMMGAMDTDNMASGGMMTTKLGGDMMMAGNKNITSKMMSMMMVGPQQGRGMMMGEGGHDMMMVGSQQGRGMMMGPMTAQAQQTDNITSSNATSVSPTTNATTNATSPAAVVSMSRPGATTTVSMALGSQSPSNPKFFVPPEITVKTGHTVTWKNDDTAIHTATSGRDVTPDGKFDTSLVSPGQSSKPIVMPTQPGQYPYFCTLHPWMMGTVIVE